MALRSYKAMLQGQMNKEDYNNYKTFLTKMGTGFTDDDLNIVYTLHAKYFDHNFNIPCGCGGARKMDTINKWIGDLTQVYENGMAT